ncbi:MAG: hypothetical protein U5R49_09850 [Deltaproteobacteria bacterium]|nr:hypothetical protein [Deltaproteobacteria bacterium]
MLDLLFNFTTWVPVIELQKIFDMTRERAVGTWLSTTLSFLAGLTLLTIFFSLRAVNGPKREAFGWLILSLFFIYMSVDDCAYIHERSGDFVKRMVSSEALPFGLSGIVGRFPSYYWHLIMGPFFVTMGFFMLYFLWKRFRDIGLLKYLVLSLSGLAVAMFLDLAEGISRIVNKLQVMIGISKTVVIHMLRLTEESLEILSIILLLFAFMRYLSIILKDKHILISK